MNERRPVMTGLEHRTAMLTALQRTERPKGNRTDPPQLPNQAMKGRMKRIEGQGQQEEVADPMVVLTIEVAKTNKVIKTPSRVERK
jgi:hypothetical protein